MAAPLKKKVWILGGYGNRAIQAPWSLHFWLTGVILHDICVTGHKCVVLRHMQLLNIQFELPGLLIHFEYFDMSSDSEVWARLAIYLIIHLSATHPQQQQQKQEQLL